MKTKQHIIIAVALLTLLTLNPQLSTAFAQGNLTPPSGPITATMKSLDQVEARTIVNTDNTPGDTFDLYIISQPGSYYLTTNLTGVSGKNGIEITANNVTLDLNGFAVQGVSGSGNGVYIPNASTNITVRNGTVSGWVGGQGVFGASTSANDLVCERLNVSANYDGIYILGSAAVRDCNCQNNVFDGIVVYGSGIVTGCTANNNGFGIEVQSGGGTVTGCTANNNGDDGIYISAGTVSGCTAQNNVLSGIEVDGNGSAVTGNTCNGNNTSGSGSGGGIFIYGNNNRVEDNQVTGSGNTGIAVASGYGYVNNVIIKNNVSGDGANNYNAPAGNDLGPVGTAASSTSPWANISH